MTDKQERERTRPLKVCYADPPYPGQAKKHYADHPDYAGEVDHRELIERMVRDYDAWILHTASTTLWEVLRHCPSDARVMAWVKPFAAYKRNISPAYAWEPVITYGGRHAEPNRIEGLTMRDWYAESITLKRGLTGVKPERVCWWIFEAMGLEPTDHLDDLFPGTGAVTRAWESWSAQLTLKAVA